MLTKPNPQKLQLAANCCHFSISVITAWEPSYHYSRTATQFLRRRLCVMIAGKVLRYKSILPSVLLLRGQGIFLEHLPKSDMFDSFSSPLPQVLHTPSFWSWSQSPGEKKKAEASCYGLSGTEAKTRQRERELEHFIIQQYLGVWVYACVCVRAQQRDRESSRHY